LKVDSKENEIVAIPRLLELLNRKRPTVTIDAMR
jgi:predicted transposase YbfD/YdcC